MKIEYDNLYTHFVFTTLGRKCLITEESRVRIEKYITGVITNQGSKLYAIYANPQHMHMLISKAPSLSEEKLASIIANSSEDFINKNKLVEDQFRWQSRALGTAAFSISKSHIDRLCKYILNQPEHHKTVSCEEEYEQFLKHYQKKSKKSNYQLL